MSKYGYKRVSSKTQELNFSLETQQEKLLGAGVPENRIFSDVCSAVGQDSLLSRPGLQNLLDCLESGDQLIVVRLDRLFRNVREGNKILSLLREKKVQLVDLSFHSPFSNVNSLSTVNKGSSLGEAQGEEKEIPSPMAELMNEFFVSILLYLSEFETITRKDRQKVGIQAAKQKDLENRNTPNYKKKYPGKKSIPLGSKIIAVLTEQYQVISVQHSLPLGTHKKIKLGLGLSRGLYEKIQRIIAKKKREFEVDYNESQKNIYLRLIDFYKSEDLLEKTQAKAQFQNGLTQELGKDGQEEIK